MEEKITKQRIIFYIDGFNFYYGLKQNNWKKYYWLDIVKFCLSFIDNKKQELILVKYFSAIDMNKDRAKRQNKFFSVNKQNNKFKLELGNFQYKDITCYQPKITKCPQCSEEVNFTCKSVFKMPEEKKTDVNIATHLISDCINNMCDVSILISGDSDLTPPLIFIKNHKPEHRINVFFPPNREGYHLKQIAHNYVFLSNYKQRFKESVFPDKIEIGGEGSGSFINKPERWI